jgi:hypothetical protein
MELRDALVPSGVNLFDYSVNIKQAQYTPHWSWKS